MELIKVVSAHRVLDSFSDKDNISAGLAYWMTKFVIKTQDEYTFYNNRLQEIVEKYSTKSGESIMIPADKIELFNDEIKALELTDVEAPGIRFSLSELSRELKLSMKQMYPLLDFIDEEK